MHYYPSYLLYKHLTPIKSTISALPVKQIPLGSAKVVNLGHKLSEQLPFPGHAVTVMHVTCST